jgi:hypothetical protein
MEWATVAWASIKFHNMIIRMHPSMEVGRVVKMHLLEVWQMILETEGNLKKD